MPKVSMHFLQGLLASCAATLFHNANIHPLFLEVLAKPPAWEGQRTVIESYNLN